MKRILLLVLCLFLAVSCSKKEEVVEAPRTYLVKTFDVEIGQKLIKKNYPGELVANRTADIAFLVSGEIIKLHAKEGIFVKKGTILAEIDDKDYKYSYDKIYAEFLRAKSDFNRAENLWANEAISKAEYEEKKAMYLGAKANKDEASKRVKDSKLRAPFDGVVSKVIVDNHQKISAGEKIITFYSRGQFDVVINIPESIVAKYREGLTLKAVAHFTDRPEVDLPLQFTEISSSVDKSTRTYALTFKVNSLKGIAALPGMSLNVDIQLQAKDAKIDPVALIPSMSVLEDNEKKRYVWAVINKDNKLTVEKKMVKVGMINSDFIEILSGLSDHDKIVTAGAHLLSDGAQVNLLEKEGGL